MVEAFAPILGLRGETTAFHDWKIHDIDHFDTIMESAFVHQIE